MQKRFVIRDERTRDTAARFVSLLSADEPMQVDIKPFKRNRSVSQNALMWQWLTIIGGELGNTKDEQHRQCKELFLVPILMRDDPDVERMGQMLEQTGDIGRLAAVLSTTHLTTAQFTAYLQDIEALAGELGITLPHPADHYYEAMGMGVRR